MDYEDPMLEPYQEFLRFKKHPLIADIIQGGKVLQQGAKTLSAGGLYTMPQLAVDGALFVGDSASMQNVQRLKGIHTAMKSGMLAAEAILSAVEKATSPCSAREYRAQAGWHLDQSGALRRPQFRPGPVPQGRGQIHHRGRPVGHRRPGLRRSTEDHRRLRRHETGDLRPPTERPGPRRQTLPGQARPAFIFPAPSTRRISPATWSSPIPELCVTRCWDTFRSPCTRFCPG